MKEIKVYVDELPKSCKTCQFQCYGECRNGCDILKTDYSMTQCHIMRGKHKDCPLIDIKTHDEEKDKKIKELEDKIRELQEVDNKRAFRLYAVLYDVLEKQDPENVASRIDFMTSENYADICELYKTAKNLKQHDRELVKGVCEKIKVWCENIENWTNDCNHRVLSLDELNEFLNQIKKEIEK